MLTTGGNADAIFPAFWQLVKKVPVPSVYTVLYVSTNCSVKVFISTANSAEVRVYSFPPQAGCGLEGVGIHFHSLKWGRKGVSLSTTSRVRKWKVSLSSQKCKCGAQRLLVFGPWWFLTIWKLWNSIFQLLIRYFTLHASIINELFAQHGKNKYKRNKEWVQ